MMILTTNYKTTSIIIVFKTTIIRNLSLCERIGIILSAIILDTKVRMVALSMIGIPKEKHRRANSKSHWPGF